MSIIERGLYRFKDVLTPPESRLTFYTGNDEFYLEGLCTNKDGVYGSLCGTLFAIDVNPFDEINGETAFTVKYSYNNTNLFVHPYANRKSLQNPDDTINPFYAYVSQNGESNWNFSSDAFYGVIEDTQFGEVVDIINETPWKELYVSPPIGSASVAFERWFAENTEKVEKTIKKGAYRFNDNTSVPFSCRWLGHTAVFDSDSYFTSAKDSERPKVFYVSALHIYGTSNGNMTVAMNILNDSGTSYYVKNLCVDGEWNNENYGDAPKTFVITSDTSVTPDFYEVFTMVTSPIGTIVHYNNAPLVVLGNNQTATLKCANQQMKGDIVVQTTDNATILQEKTATANGEVTPDSGYDGLSKVTVDVPIPDGYIVPKGEKEITKNGTHDVTEFASVNIEVPNVIPEGYVKPEGTKEITENGTYDVKQYESVDVDIEIGEILTSYNGVVEVNRWQQ